ncbi:MAG: hypothetical protein NE330_09625 [Lentisphaeraceae bacterium]|nr:hypothetical protein [Lentisphaeraceae bacterium]
MKKIASLILFLVYLNIPLHSLWHEADHACEHEVEYADNSSNDIYEIADAHEVSECSVCILNSDNTQFTTLSTIYSKSNIASAQHLLPKPSVVKSKLEFSNFSRGPPTC